MTTVRRACCILIALSVLPLTGCLGSSSERPSSTAGGEPALTDLEGVGQFRSLFNESRGTPRLLVLLSPT
jgi:hypothetical protein